MQMTVTLTGNRIAPSRQHSITARNLHQRFRTFFMDPVIIHRQGLVDHHEQSFIIAANSQ